jgi:hypothetical protein
MVYREVIMILLHPNLNLDKKKDEMTLKNGDEVLCTIRERRFR